MSGICQAVCLYLCPIPHLRPLRPNACWAGGDGLSSCTPLFSQRAASILAASAGPAFLAYPVSARHPQYYHWATVLIATEPLKRRWNHGCLWQPPVRQQPPQLWPGMSGCGSRGPIIIHTFPSARPALDISSVSGRISKLTAKVALPQFL